MTTETEIVRLTPAARTQVATLLEQRGEEGLGLRLGVSGGGCSGLGYSLDFARQEPGDHVMECEEGFRVFVDPKSLLYLRNTEVDFEGGLQGKGFSFNNPNASNTCGCGESFSV